MSALNMAVISSSHVPLLTALWSLLDGIRRGRRVLKGSWMVLDCSSLSDHMFNIMYRDFSIGSMI